MVNKAKTGSPALLMKLACLSLVRIRCPKDPNLYFSLRPLSDILLPERREFLAGYSLAHVIRNDHYPNTSAVVHFSSSDHFRAREEHAVDAMLHGTLLLHLNEPANPSFGDAKGFAGWFKSKLFEKAICDERHIIIKKLRY